MKTYKPPVKIIEVPVIKKMVECHVCGAQHDLHADTYLTVHGNMCIGLTGGIVGNNLGRMAPNEGRVMNVTVLCMTRKCILKGMFYLRPEFEFMYQPGDDPVTDL